MQPTSSRPGYFFLFRTFHSIVHCTSNIVMARFYLYVRCSIGVVVHAGQGTNRGTGGLHIDDKNSNTLAIYYRRETGFSWLDL